MKNTQPIRLRRELIEKARKLIPTELQQGTDRFINEYILLWFITEQSKRSNSKENPAQLDSSEKLAIFMLNLINKSEKPLENETDTDDRTDAPLLQERGHTLQRHTENESNNSGRTLATD